MTRRYALLVLLLAAQRAAADNCQMLTDCYSTATALIWALLGLIAVVVLPIVIENLIASVVINTALRALAATARASRIARLLAGEMRAEESLAKEVETLRDAAKGKGDFGLGSGTRMEADRLGKAWVGNDYRVASDGKTLISKDGLRQYRPPSYKPRLGRTQANFEQRLPGQRSVRWQSNGHLDIVD